MKVIFTLTLFMLILAQCAEEKPLLDQAIEARCECLKKFDQEKQNIIEVMQCSDEVNGREEFQSLDQEKILKGIKKICPDAALPQDEMIQ